LSGKKGSVPEALLRYTKVKANGLCKAPITMKYMIVDWLKVDPGKSSWIMPA